MGDLNPIEEVSVELLKLMHCPITLEPIKEPVITPQGIVFEKEALLQWIRQTGTCPLTRAPLDEEEVMLCDMSQRAKFCGMVKNHGQIIEMLNELMRVGIFKAHEIVEIDEEWLLID